MKLITLQGSPGSGKSSELPAHLQAIHTLNFPTEKYSYYDDHQLSYGSLTHFANINPTRKYVVSVPSIANQESTKQVFEKYQFPDGSKYRVIVINSSMFQDGLPDQTQTTVNNTIVSELQERSTDTKTVLVITHSALADLDYSHLANNWQLVVDDPCFDEEQIQVRLDRANPWDTYLDFVQVAGLGYSTLVPSKRGRHTSYSVNQNMRKLLNKVKQHQRYITTVGTKSTGGTGSNSYTYQFLLVPGPKYFPENTILVGNQAIDNLYVKQWAGKVIKAEELLALQIKPKETKSPVSIVYFSEYNNSINKKKTQCYVLEQMCEIVRDLESSITPEPGLFFANNQPLDSSYGMMAERALIQKLMPNWVKLPKNVLGSNLYADSASIFITAVYNTTGKSENSHKLNTNLQGINMFEEKNLEYWFQALMRTRIRHNKGQNIRVYCVDRRTAELLRNKILRDMNYQDPGLVTIDKIDGAEFESTKQIVEEEQQTPTMKLEDSRTRVEKEKCRNVRTQCLKTLNHPGSTEYTELMANTLLGLLDIALLTNDYSRVFQHAYWRQLTKTGKYRIIKHKTRKNK